VVPVHRPGQHPDGIGDADPADDHEDPTPGVESSAHENEGRRSMRAWGGPIRRRTEGSNRGAESPARDSVKPEKIDVTCAADERLAVAPLGMTSGSGAVVDSRVARARTEGERGRTPQVSSLSRISPKRSG
jgi:hypothetical protein